MTTNQNHVHLFTHPPLRLAANPDQDTIPDIAATARKIACPLADMDADAFTHAHRIHRTRGAFRLLGALGSLVIAFVQSLDGLVSYHEAHYVLVAAPAVASVLLGELVVLAHRAARAPRIPIARVISGRRRVRA